MAIPAKVAVNPRARVTAGLAKDVDDVNQYAAVMVRPTRLGMARGAWRRPPKIATISENVATDSANHCAPPLRAVAPIANGARSNIRCAAAVPARPPRHCTAM